MSPSCHWLNRLSWRNYMLGWVFLWCKRSMFFYYLSLRESNTQPRLWLQNQLLCLQPQGVLTWARTVKLEQKYQFSEKWKWKEWKGNICEATEWRLLRSYRAGEGRWEQGVILALMWPVPQMKGQRADFLWHKQVLPLQDALRERRKIKVRGKRGRRNLNCLSLQ